MLARMFPAFAANRNAYGDDFDDQREDRAARGV
jgi:hypothetical protein